MSRFIIPEIASRAFDFEGEALFQEDLYGPKVRISNTGEIKDEVDGSIKELVQLLMKDQLTKNDMKQIQAELKQNSFPVRWQDVTQKQFIDYKDFKQDRLPITALVNQFYSEVRDMGGGRFDTSSLIKRLR